MVATIINVIVILSVAIVWFWCGRIFESHKHKYVGRLLVTTDKEDGSTYLTCDLDQLSSIEEINKYNTVTLKIQRVL